MSKKKGKTYGKLLLDLILLVLLALMYRKQAISMHFHETGGLVLCGLFLVHKALNWKWIRAVTVAIFQKKAKLTLRWIVDALLLAAMTAVLITGLLISKTLPTAIANGHGLQIWHYFCAAAALVLSGIHLGFHGAYMRHNLWNKLPLPKKAGKTIGILLLCALFCFGSYNLLTSGFASHFTRPFVSTAAVRESDNPDFEKMEHSTGEHSGRKGMDVGKGMGNGQGMSKNQVKRGSNFNAPANAISTFTTYASILCWFALVTAVLEYLFSRRGVRNAKKRRKPERVIFNSKITAYSIPEQSLYPSPLLPSSDDLEFVECSLTQSGLSII